MPDDRSTVAPPQHDTATARSVASLEIQLIEAHNAIANARRRLTIANIDMNDAVKRYDDCAKELEAFVAELRANAPDGTDWYQRHYRQSAAASE